MVRKQARDVLQFFIDDRLGANLDFRHGNGPGLVHINRFTEQTIPQRLCRQAPFSRLIKTDLGGKRGSNLNHVFRQRAQTRDLAQQAAGFQVGRLIAGVIADPAFQKEFGHKR